MFTTLNHTIKIESLHFFGISTLISWANTFKIREFQPKIENFHHRSIFVMKFILKKNNYDLYSSYQLNQRIYLFLDFPQLFNGLTLLKFENFDKILKTSTTAQIFS